MVVRGSKDAQIVCSGDGSAVLWLRITNGSSVLGNGSFLRVIAGFGTNQKPFVAQNGVNVGYRALKNVEEGPGVEVWLLEVEVDLSSESLGLGYKVRNSFGLQSIGNLVIQLDFRLEDVGSGPRLGEGQACSAIEY